MRLITREVRGEVRTLYVTPCCGATHFLFLDEPLRCHMCGGLLEEEAQHRDKEKDLSHLRFIPVTRYVS